jgi:hypothetical protein
VRVEAWFAICAAECAAVLQIRRDARRPKGVVADLGSYLGCVTRNRCSGHGWRDLGGDASGFGAPLNHRVGVCLGQRVAGELAGRAAVGLEKQCLRLVRKARDAEIFMQVGFVQGYLLTRMFLSPQFSLQTKTI